MKHKVSAEGLATDRALLHTDTFSLPKADRFSLFQYNIDFCPPQLLIHVTSTASAKQLQWAGTELQFNPS